MNCFKRLRSVRFTEQLYQASHIKNGIPEILYNRQKFIGKNRIVSSDRFTSSSATQSSENVGGSYEKKNLTNIVEPRDLYEILDITPDATATEVREAFFSKAKIYHPDVDSSSDAKQEFLKSREAYQILSNTLERHEYDKLIIGSNQGRANRRVGLTEEAEKRSLEKAKEDQETFLSTKQEMRRATYGASPKWRDEYEWVIKLTGGGGGRNLRRTANIDSKGRPLDRTVKPIGKFEILAEKYFAFEDKYRYNYAEVEQTEVVRRHKLVLGFMLSVFCLAMISRMYPYS